MRLVERLARLVLASGADLLPEPIGDRDPDKARKAIAVMMRMKEPDAGTLRRATA